MQRTLFSLAVVGAIATTLSAQCTAPAANQSFTNVPFVSSTTFTTGSLTYGANLYFDLAVNQTITLNSFFVNCYDAGLSGFPDLRGQIGELELWTIPTTAVGQTGVGTGGTVPATPPGWTSLGRTQCVIQDVDLPTGGPIASGPLVLAPGTYGFAVNYLHIIAGQPNAGAVLHPLYTNPGANPVPLVNSDQFLTVSAVGSQSNAWTSGLLSRVINLTLDYTIMPNSAYSTPYGDGCYDRKQSFYESFAATPVPGGAAIDLVNSSLSLTNLGDQFLMTPGVSTYPHNGITPGSTTHYDVIGAGATPTHVNTIAPGFAQTPDWDDCTSVPYPLPFPFPYPGDGGVPATDVIMNSNGSIYLGTTQPLSTRFFDAFTGWLDGPPSFAAAFTDLWPFDGPGLTGGVGEMYMDSDGATYVTMTWENCDEFPNDPVNFSTGNSFQITLFAGGNVEFTFQNVAMGYAPCLVGFTPGNGSPDPGSGATPRMAPDLSAAAAQVGGYLSGDGAKPAQIRVINNRANVGQPLTLEVGNVDASVAGNVSVISTGSFAAPGVGLGVLGMPGCFALVTLPEVASQFLLGPGPYVWNVINPIPLAFAGVDVYAQSLQFSTRVPAFNVPNLLTSDAVCIHFDLN